MRLAKCIDSEKAYKNLCNVPVDTLVTTVVVKWSVIRGRVMVVVSVEVVEANAVD